jgi:hypothetical protein
MVSVGSTDTYNFLPTDMKDGFCSSALLISTITGDLAILLAAHVATSLYRTNHSFKQQVRRVKIFA